MHIMHLISCIFSKILPFCCSFFVAGTDYKFFDIDQITGKVTVKKRIPDDELLQPATLVVKVRRRITFIKLAISTRRRQ